MSVVLRALVRGVGQAAVYAALAAILGYFSSQPAFTRFAADRAFVKLSVSHPGKPKGECRRRTPEEIAKLAPNMRRPLDCPRERWPVTVEVEIDGRPLYRGTAQPAGIAKDGASSFYATFRIPAGVHRVAARLKERGDRAGFDYDFVGDIRLAPAQAAVVGFRAEEGRIFVR